MAANYTDATSASICIFIHKISALNKLTIGFVLFAWICMINLTKMQITLTCT